jgi:hypothetical protein
MSFGIIVTILCCYIFKTDLVWYYIIFGVSLSLLPDLDALPELFKNGRVAAHAGNTHDHRDGLHYPLIVVPVSFVLPYFLNGPFWAFMIGFNIFLHFAIDSFGLGWGVKWLYPFTNKNYKFDFQSTSLLKSWDPETLTEMIHHHGDPNWFSKYIKTKMFAAEVFLFISTLSVAIYLLQSPLL